MSIKQNIIITEAEKAYRTKYYHFFQVVSKRQISCCSCGNELSSSSKFVFSHPILEILQCNTCLDKFKNTNFKSSKNKCLICCSSSTYNCSSNSCRYEFCRKCIKRNVNKCIQEAEKDNWKCFVCNVKPFWELRGICAAIMALPNKRQSLRNKEKINSPYQQRKMRKSERTVKKLTNICDVSSGDSSDDEPNNIRPLFQPNRRKLYSSIKENIEITQDIISSDDDDNDEDKKERKKATSKFHKNFSIYFTNLRKSLAKISTAIDACEEQCRNTIFTSKNDALEITKNFESLLMETETLTIENSKEINKTYQSWSRNYSSYFKEKNGYKKRKKKNSSTNDDDEEKNGTEEEPIEKKRILKVTNNEVPSDCDSDEIFSANDKTNSLDKSDDSSRRRKEKEKKKKVTTSEDEDSQKTIIRSRQNSSLENNSPAGKNKETKKSRKESDTDSRKNSDLENDCVHSIGLTNDSDDDRLSTRIENNREESTEEKAKKKLLETSSSEEIKKRTVSSDDDSPTDDESASKTKTTTKKKNKETISENDDSNSEKEANLKKGKKDKKSKEKLPKTSEDSDSEKEAVSPANDSEGEKTSDKKEKTSRKDKKLEEKSLLPSTDDSESDKEKNSPTKSKANAGTKKKLLQTSDDTDSETPSKQNKETNSFEPENTEENAKKKLLATSDDSDSENLKTESRDKIVEETPEEVAKKKLLATSEDSEFEKETIEEKTKKKPLVTSEDSDLEKETTEEKAKKKLLETSDDSEKETRQNSSAERIDENTDEQSSEVIARRKLFQSSDDSQSEGTQNKIQSSSKEEEEEETASEKEKKKSNNDKSSKELEAKRKLLESSDSLSEKELTPEKNSTEDNDKTEASAKRKLLESSDESFNEKANSNEMDKNSEEEAKKKLLRSNSDLSSVDDSRIDETINGRSKGSNSSSSSVSSSLSSDEKSQDLFTSLDVESLKRKRNNSDDDNNSETGRMRRKKKFKITKNQFYRADEKLRFACRVELERLGRKVLKNHARALKKSRQHLEREKHKSLLSMDNLEKGRKRNKFVSSSDDDDDDDGSASKVNQRNRKKVNEKDDTLMDHLNKVENGEVNDEQEEVKTSDDESSNELPKKIVTKKDLFNAAEQNARDMLLASSGSDVEMAPEIFDETESAIEESKGKKTKEKAPKESKKKEKVKEENAEEDKSEKNNSDDSSADEKEKKQTAKEKYKNDKLLRTKISDSDSEVEKEKFDKRKKKLEEKKKKKGDSSSNEEDSQIKKKKKRVKRKILDSDSDIEILSDSESSSSSKASKSKEETKKSRKRGKQKSSDSDDSIEEKKPKTKRKRIKQVSDSDSDSDAVTNSQSSPIKGGRKNIRKVLKDKQVADDTKQAAKEEEERLKRIAERQKVYNEMYEIRLAGEEKVDKLVLDFDEETKKELISVDPGLVKRLKPHQAKGIKFMWDACFESVSRINSSKGSGCIIAHCMGLGKTFQVVTLVHTLLSHKETGVNNVMIVCPLSTALNWAGEFEMWLKDLKNFEDIDVIELGRYKQNFERKYQLEYWKKNGGVLIIGYDMFRTLTGTGKRLKKSMQTSFLQCLVDPGPDVIVCDEGHLLKNEDTALSKAMRRVKTLRRIVLTGTPLQNNLVEYHCMVQFVKPNLLGTKKEFSNRFVNPIKNGSTADSTPYDVKLMKKRAFILHNLLEGSVQRFDYSVLTPFLPPKQEYVISVKLSPLQIELYQYYLDNFTRGGSARGPKLFADYHALQRICTHPIVMRMNAEKMEKKRLEEESDSEGSLKDFIDDGSDTSASSSGSDNDGSDVQCVDSDKDVPVPRRGTRANPVENQGAEAEPETLEPREWWSEKIKPEHFDDMRVSAKLVLLFGILRESEKLGDKVLVFSQSLYSLTLIEDFLSRIDDAAQNNTQSENIENHSGSWSLGLDYFRLDGQTSADNRAQWCKIFNRETNTRARLFLISTRAGGLGINLTAANRVIIFDASWNPSHDVQSIFRIYRFGQKKPCYIYRFLSKGTMEEKIYNRQVSKLSLACRVIDEQQIERHFNSSDLDEMYTFNPNPPKDSQTLSLPKDRLLAELFLQYKELVHNYHEHDSLLENQLDEVLDEEERKLAWQEYEEEKKGRPVMQFNNVNPFGLNPMNVNMFPNQGNIVAEVERMVPLLRKDYPTRTDDELRIMAQSTVLNMYSSIMERQAMQRSHQNQFVQQPYAMQSYIQQQQYQYQQQQQLLRMQRQQQQQQQQQQQHPFPKMSPAGRPPGRPPGRPVVVDISSPNGKEE